MRVEQPGGSFNLHCFAAKSPISPSTTWPGGRLTTSSTCLDLHSAAAFTGARVTECSHGEVVGFPAVQVGEAAGGVCGVAPQSRPHAAGGRRHVELHVLSVLPEHVGRSGPAVQVHADTQRLTGTWRARRVERWVSGDSRLLRGEIVAQLTCAEGDIGEPFGLAVIADGREADVVRPAAPQLGQMAPLPVGLAWSPVAVLRYCARPVGVPSFGEAPRHLGRVVAAIRIRCHISRCAGSLRGKKNAILMLTQNSENQKIANARKKVVLLATINAFLAATFFFLHTVYCSS